MIENTAARGDGGAVYITSGVILNIGSEKTISDIIFIDNRASGSGGAIFVDNSSLTLAAKTDGADIIFKGNKSGDGKDGRNDIFVSSKGFVSFSAENKRKIELNEGIMGKEGTNIEKDGEGILYIGGYIGYLGTTEIKVGKIQIMGAQITEHKAQLGNLTIRASGELEIKSLAQEMSELNINGTAQIDGKLTITGNAAKNKADIINVSDGGSIAIGSGTSALSVKVYGGIGDMEVKIIDAKDISGYFKNYYYNSDGQISEEYKHTIGVFKQETYLRYYNEELRFGAQSRSNFEGYIAGLTHNQQEVGKMFDGLDNSRGIEDLVTGLSVIAIEEEEKGDGKYEKTKEAFDKISGSFIIRAIENGAQNNSESALYSKIKEIEARDKARKLGQIWVQANMEGSKYTGEEAVGETKEEGFGFQAGMPIYRGQASLGGIYVGYAKKSIKEENDKAEIGDIEAGIYAGKYYDNKVNVKGNIGIGLMGMDIKRKIELPEFSDELTSNFNVLKAQINAQAQYTINASNEIDIRPLVGIKNAILSNGIINEDGGQAALEVRSKLYFRSLWLAGLGIEDEKGALKWNIRGYGGYSIIGRQGEYDIKLKNSDGQYMSVRGYSFGTEIGVGAGIEYQIGDKSTLYANGNISYGKEMEGYYANIGFIYKLGESYEEQIGNLDESDEEEESQIRAEYEAQDIRIVRLLAAEFANGKSDITKEARENIRLAAKEIKKYDYIRITIEGSADSTGIESRNKSLSIMRARAVYEELYKNGIPLTNMRYIEFKGSRIPIASNMTEEGRARNRRAEIVIEYPDRNPRSQIKRERVEIGQIGQTRVEEVQMDDEEEFQISPMSEQELQDIQNDIINLRAIDVIRTAVHEEE
jgi:predicted outer membrane repeat protein